MSVEGRGFDEPMNVDDRDFEVRTNQLLDEDFTDVSASGNDYEEQN